MAIQSQTVSVSASFTSISINGNTTRTRNITWTPPSLPEGAVIKSCNVAGDLVISMNRGSATVTINRKNYTSSQAIIVSLGTSITSSLSVKAKGSSMFSSGTVSMKNLVYEVVYEYDDGLYTVTFKDWDGSILKTETVEEGNDTTPPNTPTRDGHLCIGWDKTYTNITTDTTITAQYVKEQGVPSNDILTPFSEWGIWDAFDIQRKANSISLNTTATGGGVSLFYPTEWMGRDITFGVSDISSNSNIIIQHRNTYEPYLVINTSNKTGTINIPIGSDVVIVYQNLDTVGGIWVTDLYAIDNTPTGTYNIKTGTTTISNIHLGNTKVDKVYIGDILVFEHSNTSDRFTTLLPVDGVIPLTEIPVKTGQYITFEYTGRTLGYVFDARRGGTGNGVIEWVSYPNTADTSLNYASHQAGTNGTITIKALKDNTIVVSGHYSFGQTYEGDKLKADYLKYEIEK